MNIKDIFSNKNREVTKCSINTKNLSFKKYYYSQDGEDSVLFSFYEDRLEYKGFYVDIGALHPLRFSNTHLFYERGWRGINIDAMPGSMKEFNEIRKEDINIEAGISESGSELIFYSFKDPALNSFNKKISETRIANGWELIEKINIKTFSINDILNKYLPENQKIDFINIDAEGLDFEIIKSLDWKKYKPDFLLAENLELKNEDIVQFGGDEMYRYLKELGYIVIAKTMRTVIFKNKKDVQKN